MADIVLGGQEDFNVFEYSDEFVLLAYRDFICSNFRRLRHLLR